MDDRILPSDKKGFTMIEVLVAMVILVVGMLGLLQAVNLAIETNVKNIMRDEAVFVAEEQMSRAKIPTFANITCTGQKTIGVQKATRSIFKTYSASKTVDVATSDRSKRIQVGVAWRHRGIRYEHLVSSVIGNPN